MAVFNPDNPIAISNTVGESILVEDVMISLPRVPVKSTILFSKKSKPLQRWVRQEPPKELKRSNIESHSKFIEEELRRIQNGIWFMNFGEPTYITGLHYYYVNYVKIDVGYPEYRERDRMFFYFWEAAHRYEKCTGVTLVKPRRMGATWIGSGMINFYGSQIRDALLGILSKTGADAKSMFTKKVVSVFKKLPFWLQPTSASGTNPKTSLDFTEISRRGKDTEQGIEESEALNTIIEWRNTTENSFDSEKLVFAVCDEFGKLDKEISLETLWEVLSKTLYVGLRIVGKIFMPSTVNDLDSGGEQYKTLFMASRISEMIEGKTPTGLWGYFVPAYDGLEGFIDIYGRSVIEDPVEPIMGIHGEMITEGSKTALLRERELKKKISKKAYLENVRQYPWSIEEAFYFNANTATLDTEKIANQISHNENNLIINPVKRGDLVWEVQDKEVKWIPNPENGRFHARWIPPKDMRNRYYTRGGQRRPSNEMYGSFGVDPYETDIAVHGRGSNGGLHGHTKSVVGGRDDVPKYQCFLEYIDRPATAKDFFEDCLKAAFFWGMPILFENNKYSLARHFEARGFIEYLSLRPKDSYQKDARYHKTNQKTRGVPSNKDTNETHAGILQLYVHENIGEDEETGIMGDFPWTRSLREMAKFSIEDRGDLDGAVSLGLAIWACGGKEVDISEKKRERKPFIKKGKLNIQGY